MESPTGIILLTAPAAVTSIMWKSSINDRKEKEYFRILNIMSCFDFG
jgi:hypothetical protein